MFEKSFPQSFLQIVMHILQKVFFEHALKKRTTERKDLITEERGLFLEKEVKVQENKMGDASGKASAHHVCTDDDFHACPGTL